MPNGDSVASVTTILAETKAAEDKEALENWRKSIGYQQAEQITMESANRGTRMHRWLENYIQNDEIGTPGSHPASIQSHKMASIIIENYLSKNVTAYYGSECNLYCSGLYAGTTDVVADWNGTLSIIDFKQTNKPKKDDYVHDYKCQIVSYAVAHNEMFGTEINQGVILMCSQEFQPQHWVLKGEEFQHYMELWLKRLEEYYESR